MSKHISDEIILETIERGFDALGESPKQAIWFCLEEKFGFNPKKVPKNIAAFQEALQKIFGLGYDFLDVLFRQYLHEATGEKFVNCENFTQCVAFLKNGGALKPIEKPAK